MQSNLGIIDSVMKRIADRCSTLGERIDEEACANLAKIQESGWRLEVLQDIKMRYLGFPYWDSLVFPIMSLGGIRELRKIPVVRLSPDDATSLDQGGAEHKLLGVKLWHFGAFFKRRSRENDFLWGRLDAVDQLIDLVVDTIGVTDNDVAELCKFRAMERILKEESGRLKRIRPLLKELTEKVARLLAQCEKNTTKL